MLDNSPTSATENGSQTKDDDIVVCAQCDSEITRARWAISRNGDHEHTVFNPAGQVFTILCFKEAPGIAAIGDPSNEFSWFQGFDWRIALCRGCNAHLGWQYIGMEIFFGLIKIKLSFTKRNDTSRN